MAGAICDGLAEPGFKDRGQWQQRIQLLLSVFEACGIDGACLRIFTASELQTLWLAQTSTYTWGRQALSVLHEVLVAADENVGQATPS